MYLGRASFSPDVFEGVNVMKIVNENFVTNVTLPYMSHIKIKLTVKPIRAIYTRKLRRVLHKTRLK